MRALLAIGGRLRHISGFQRPPPLFFFLRPPSIKHMRLPHPIVLKVLDFCGPTTWHAVAGAAPVGSPIARAHTRRLGAAARKVARWYSRLRRSVGSNSQRTDIRDVPKGLVVSRLVCCLPRRALCSLPGLLCLADERLIPLLGEHKQALLERDQLWGPRAAVAFLLDASVSNQLIARGATALVRSRIS